MIKDRQIGLAVAFFGLFLLAWLIPHHTEDVGYGWLRPQTVPQICGVLLMALGGMLIIAPGPNVPPNLPFLRLVSGIAVTALGLWLMPRLGYLITAPLMAAPLIFLIGERRPVWVLLGLALAPSVVWLVVTTLLGRPLP